MSAIIATFVNEEKKIEEKNWKSESKIDRYATQKGFLNHLLYWIRSATVSSIQL